MEMRVHFLSEAARNVVCVVMRALLSRTVGVECGQGGVTLLPLTHLRVP